MFGLTFLTIISNHEIWFTSESIDKGFICLGKRHTIVDDPGKWFMQELILFLLLNVNIIENLNDILKLNQISIK